MTLVRLAAFSDGEVGGNPAGVYLSDTLPTSQRMQQIAADVGYSETAFAAPFSNGWRVRYFSPESEVPFCGHATIALGAALTQEYGSSVYELTLNEATITVEGFEENGLFAAALQSPETFSRPAEESLVQAVLELLGMKKLISAIKSHLNCQCRRQSSYRWFEFARSARCNCNTI